MNQPWWVLFLHVRPLVAIVHVNLPWKRHVCPMRNGGAESSKVLRLLRSVSNDGRPCALIASVSPVFERQHWNTSGEPRWIEQYTPPPGCLKSPSASAGTSAARNAPVTTNRNTRLTPDPLIR